MKHCSYCGRENADDATQCIGCGTELKDNTPPITTSAKLTKAGFGIRALARIIDTIFGMCVGLVAGLFAGQLLVALHSAGIVSAGWQYRVRGFSLLGLLCGIVGNTLYHCLCEGMHGASLGKLCCGLRVVSEDGSPSTYKGTLIRSLAYFIDGLFFGIIGYMAMQKSPLNQRNGDVWGKTAVLKTSEVAPGSARSPAHFILGFALGAACWMIMGAIGFILKVLWA